MRDFSHTVNVLVKAYLNDWLLHDDPCGCAVGNMISEGAPTIDKFHWNKDYNSWYSSLGLSQISGQEDFNHPDIIKTGYTPQELIKIEYAFERSDRRGDQMFNGLMAVVDVLADIHNISLEEKKEAKALFVKL